MKITKLIKRIVAILCILVMILPTSLSVMAKIDNATEGTQLDFGITLVHTSKTLDGKKDVSFGYATETSSKPIYRIFSGTDDYSTTVLCLNKDLRYPKENDESNVTYTSQGEAAKETLQKAKIDLSEDETEKILWLIRNAVAPEDSEAMRDLKLAKIFDSDLNGTETNKLTLDEIKSVLTEDDLVFAMQFALYEITNHIELKAPQGTKDGKTWAALNGTTFDNKGKYITKIIEFYAQELEKSERTDIIDSQSPSEDNLTIINGENDQDNEDGKAGVVQKGGYAFIGPFQITGAEGSDYTVKISLLNEQDEDTKANFYILDGSTAESKRLSCTPKDLNGKKFYVQVRTNTPAKKVKIEVKSGISIQSAKGYVWTKDSEVQPLLSLERSENIGKNIEKECPFEITNNKQYDVALRKYITSVKRKADDGDNWQIIWQGEQDTRTPKDVDSNAKQETGAFNQYEYKHRKDPLEVKVGDRITYTIEIINEENTAVKVTKVTDYLPPKGLQFVQEENQNGITWTYDEDKRAASTDFFKDFSPNSVLEKREAKIVLEVTEDAVGKVLTNIAEITEFKDKNDDTVITEDLDSGPGNVQLPTTEEEWENYKGNEDNKDELNDPDYYYKGQQDDDDFEKVTVKPEESEYDIQIKKVDKYNPETGLQGAQFSVILPDKTTQTIETDSEGTATTSKIHITNKEDEAITIKETKAPDGYKLIDETFVIDVTKEIKDGKYALKELKLRNESSNANLNADIENNKIILTVQNKKDGFDLRLKKFITQIGDMQVTDREPKVTLSGGVLKYEHTKSPKQVKTGQRIVYTIRVYNEGIHNGYAAEIKDDIPTGLKFLPNDKTNTDYGWKMYDSRGNVTVNVANAKKIKTDYLSKEKSDERGEKALQAFDPQKEIDKTNPDCRDVQVAFEVSADVDEFGNKAIVNTAEISKDQSENGDEVEDVDSTPDNNKEKEDDIDKEYIQLTEKEFDLSLRKFITQIGNKQILDREPKVRYEDEKIKYNHSKTPLTVVQGQKIVYTIRVYNEGKQDGYAAEIKDDIPTGLTFLPNDETNKTYGWKMYDSNGTETNDISKAKTIKTNYLSKEKSEDNLLKAFDSNAEISDTNPDHKDVKVAFEVNTDSISSKNKTIVNTAEITKDKNKDGKDVDDIDSTPGNGEPGEDDIDKEYVETKYFDLSLLKYVSKVIVTEDGATKETETGYDGTENPEPIVKVELDRKKLDKTEIKYVYTIKVINEGEIEGYAKEITDRIPKGLEFYEEDNKQYGWKVKESGIVTTDYLKDTLLQPGENATVQIVLRWIRSDKNLGEKINVAEITVDDNQYDSPDIDSTPNNNKDGEDDQDNATVVLSVSTGSTSSYLIGAIVFISFIGIGTHTITKYVIIK